MRRHHTHPTDYDAHGYDERQERVSASKHGRVSAFEIGGYWTPGAWGDER